MPSGKPTKSGLLPAWVGRLPAPGFLPADFVPPEELPRTFTMGERFWLDDRDEDGSVAVAWSMGRADGGRGEMRVWYEEGGDRVARVQLSLPDGLSPKDLSRFAWARWLGIADATRRLREEGSDIPPALEDFRDWSEVVDLMLGSKRPRRRVTHKGRPGRRGHPDSHYEDVAESYKEFLRLGKHNPTQEIARNSHVSRGTAAGWVRGARQRGYLEPAVPGRPG